MQYVTLGKTGLKISRVGFGGIPIQRIDAEKAKPLIDALIECGINYIDTARGYTVSEEYIGGAIDGRRDKFVLATKSMARTREAMEADIETSLRNLRTCYIDLYQVHNPSMEQLDTVIAAGGALEALFAARDAGKIGHIGITAHSLTVFERALELDWVETIMFPYNIVESQCEPLLQKCRDKNIGFIAMKPMAGGAIEEIAKIRSELTGNFCRRCNYCAPCTVGISIPNVFLFAGYLERYGLADWAKGRYKTLPVKASACIGCGKCEPRCPYGLPIRSMLKKCAEEFGE